MARFRATIQGMRGEASRLGSKSSGLVVTANGWNAGVSVCVRVDEDGNDHFTVLKTGGSGGGITSTLAEFTDHGDEYPMSAEAERSERMADRAANIHFPRS